MTEEKLLELCREITSEVRDEDYYERCPICDGGGIMADGTKCSDCDGFGWTEI